MARLAGVDLPREKRMEIALTYIYGIGRTRALELLAATGISPDLRSKDLTDEDVLALRNGPLTAWNDAYTRMWAQAEARGEVAGLVAEDVVSEATSALLVQRWLLSGLPVTHEYADEVLRVVVLPLLRAQRP